MKLFTIMGKLPGTGKKRTNKKLAASRKNGAVKVYHPAAIKAMNHIAGLSPIKQSNSI